MEPEVRGLAHERQSIAALSGVYLAMGRNAEAESTSRRSCSLRASRTCYTNLGVALQRQRRTKEAIAAYEQALLFGSADQILLLNIADAYEYDGQKAKALDFFARCVARGKALVSLNLQNSGARAILGYCLAKTGDRSGATFELDQAWEHSPDDKNVRRYGVLTFESLGERQRALEILRNSPPEVVDELERSWGTEQLQQDPGYDAAAAEARKKKGVH